ncbi:MAG: FG-GAP-like repeat-containing protein [Bacteroidales bacterium]|nr:FG-GAP-like repeat-containing protein [Bacteroidales bacterium]
MKTKIAFSILAILFLFSQFGLSDGYKVPKYAYSLDVCDIDNDGDIDIILGSNNYGSDTISILMNDGYGNFSLSYLIRSNFVNIICSCINADNLPDIVSHSSVDSAWVYYPNYGDGIFGNSIIISKIVEQKINLFNLDQNNSPDFICYDQSPNGILGALYNNGSGSFSHCDIFAPPYGGISEPDAGDLNGDSLNDILVSDYNSGVSIFYNQDSGVFNQQNIDINPVTHTYIFDINNDGFNDLGLYRHVFFPGGICTLKIFVNQSFNFILTDTILFPQGTLFVNFADYNNDNYFDIVYVRGLWSGSLDSLYIVLNNQDLTFSSPDRYYVPSPQLLVVKSADFDGNGYNDIAYTYYGSQDYVTILFNDGSGKFVENPLTSINAQVDKDIHFNVYPNPFNSGTRIRIANVQYRKNLLQFIYISDLKGNTIKYLPIADFNSLDENYDIYWDGKDNQGKRCSSGIYLLECIVGNFKYFTKIILVNN